MKGLGSPVSRLSTGRAGRLPARKPPGCARRSGRARAGVDAGAEPLPAGAKPAPSPGLGAAYRGRYLTSLVDRRD